MYTMIAKKLVILALAVSAAAVHDNKKRDDIDASEIAAIETLASEFGITTLPTNSAQLQSLESELAVLSSLLPAWSIISVLETAVPASVISDLQNPTSASAFASQIEVDNSTPGWYASLPDNVKEYFSTWSPSLNVATSSASSSVSSALSSLSASEASAASASATSSTPSQTASSTSSQTGASAKAHSTAGAPKPTAAIAASFVGLFGVLGLAMGL